MTVTSHGRLIHADQYDRALITHHCCPKNGIVHDGHPNICTDPHCRVWAEHLAAKSETERIHRVNTELRNSESRGVLVPVLIITGLMVLALMAMTWWAYNHFPLPF